MNLEELRTIPKVELHRHLECSVRLSTLLELARLQALPNQLDLQQVREQFLITSPMTNLSAVLKKFANSQSVLNSEEVLCRITYEAIEDAFEEGIKILELRWAPTFISSAHSHLSFDKIIRAIRKGAQMAAHLPMAVGFIAIVQRTRPVAEAESIVDFAIENKDFFVAMDLADDEDSYAPNLFETAFTRAKKQGLHITIHAGETNSDTAAKNVKDSIEILGAERIGHGIQIFKDQSIIEIVRKKAIPLEVSLTSNYLTRAVEDYKDHPIRKLMNAGVPITINTDDPGLFATSMVNEYSLLQKYFAFTPADFDRCNDVAAQASFINIMKKQKYWPRPIHSLR